MRAPASARNSHLLPRIARLRRSAVSPSLGNFARQLLVSLMAIPSYRRRPLAANRTCGPLCPRVRLADDHATEMTAGETAEAAVEYAAPWIERLARMGFAAKALLYTTIGILAAQMPFGDGQRASTQAAMHSVQHAPFGRFLIGLVAIGLV